MPGLEAAVTRNPKDTRAIKRLADAHASLHRPNEALSYYRAAAALLALKGPLNVGSLDHDTSDKQLLLRVEEIEILLGEAKSATKLDRREDARAAFAKAERLSFGIATDVWTCHELSIIELPWKPKKRPFISDDALLGDLIATKPNGARLGGYSHKALSRLLEARQTLHAWLKSEPDLEKMLWHERLREVDPVRIPNLTTRRRESLRRECPRHLRSMSNM